MACDISGSYYRPRRATGSAASRRLAGAFCASVLVHAWLLAASPGGVPARLSTFPAWRTISARIAAPPSADTRGIPPDSFAALPLPPLQDERATETVRGAPARPAGV